MQNATQTFSPEEYAEFLEFKKLKAEQAQANEQQKVVEAVKAGDVKVEDMVKADPKLQALNEKKIKFADETGFMFSDDKQALIATVLSFAQCLASTKATTLMLKTDDDVANDFMHIYGSWAYRTTMHTKLNSTEACMTANAKPFFSTMGTQYNSDHNEHFRVLNDEPKRGSQFVVAPTTLTSFTTQSKEFIGSFNVGLTKVDDKKIDWNEITPELNRLRNDIDSDQFDLVKVLSPDIKARLPLIMEQYNICNDQEDFKKYALIIAVATYLDIDSFIVVKDAILEMANKIENGNVELFKTSLLEVFNTYKLSGAKFISTHTMSGLLASTSFGNISVIRLQTMLKKLDLKTSDIKQDFIPTQGLMIAEAEDKLAA